MDKIDALVREIQNEIRRHDWDSFAFPVDDDEPTTRSRIWMSCGQETAYTSDYLLKSWSTCYHREPSI